MCPNRWLVTPRGREWIRPALTTSNTWFLARTWVSPSIGSHGMHSSPGCLIHRLVTPHNCEWIRPIMLNPSNAWFFGLAHTSQPPWCQCNCHQPTSTATNVVDDMAYSSPSATSWTRTTMADGRKGFKQQKWPSRSLKVNRNGAIR